MAEERKVGVKGRMWAVGKEREIGERWVSEEREGKG